MWLGGSWSNGDSKGESKNVDEISFVGEYAGGGCLGGKSVCIVDALVDSASLLLWLDGGSPSSECFKLFSLCSDITSLFAIYLWLFKWW